MVGFRVLRWWDAVERFEARWEITRVVDSTIRGGFVQRFASVTRRRVVALRRETEQRFVVGTRRGEVVRLRSEQKSRLERGNVIVFAWWW